MIQMQAQPQDKRRYQRKIKNIVGWISLFILYLLIIAYAILIQSIYSTIAVICMLISIICNISDPVHLALKKQDDSVFEWTKVVSFNVDRILWIMYVIVGISFFIVKAVLFYVGIDNLSTQLQQMLQVQSSLSVFLPLILLPFAATASIKRPRSKLLKDYSQRLKPYIALPLYLIFGALIILMQIFSVSVAGLIYFALAIFLFWMKNFNFKDKEFKVLLIIVQTMTTIVLSSSYLVTISYLQTPTTSQYYQIFGINSMNQFSLGWNNQGHILCEVILCLLTAYLNKLFIYQTFNYMLRKDESSQQDGQFVEINKAVQNLSNLKQQKQKIPQPKRARSQIVKLSTNKVLAFQKQVQMRDFSERGSARSNQFQLPQRISKKSSQSRQKIDQKFYDFINYQQQLNIGDESPQPVSKKKKDVKMHNQKNFGRIKRQFLQGINTVFKFLNSPQFSLRVVQLLSIVVIQRFNNIYSFVALIWLAMVASIQNKKFILIITAFVMFPMELVNFFITYFYNIPYSPALKVQNAEIYGFSLSTQMWLNILVFNLYFNYVVLFIRSYKQINKNVGRNIKQARKKPAGWQLFVAFLFRYSYLLTLLAMFFLGFSYPTLINIILVALFLIFFSNGDNLIISKRIRGGRQRLTLTTFAKKYWFIIVYYTLLCIVAKYIYFLFFAGQETVQLQPTGINQIYDWSFNFSLSSYCPSQTTPWFIVFVLAQIQIIIYRSYIYTQLSFSLISYISEEDNDNKSNKKKNKHKQNFIKFIVGFNEFYYQSLYYITGIIVLACSYRWSMIGLVINIFTIIGLLTHFNKKILAVILFLNLAYIFMNFFIGFINNYQIVAQTIGQSVINVINQISLFIGFTITIQSYTSLFILNVVIFYFCVLSYGLANVLESPIRQNSIQLSQQSERRASFRQNLREQNEILRRPSFIQKSVVESQFQDEKFAENYQRGVIIEAQNYYHQNLIKKYTWLREIGKFLVIFWTDIVAVFVILQCLYFRVSISMLLFLIIYMVFYFTLFERLGSLYRNSGYYDYIESQLARFTGKQYLLEQQSNFKSLISDKQSLLKTEQQLCMIQKSARLLKNTWKKKIWKYSAILSSVCCILTFASQFIISQFYTQNINFQYTTQLEVGLFILGINVDSGKKIGLYIYFYYVMLIINVFQKLIIKFIDKIGIIAAEEDMDSIDLSISALPGLQNPEYLINTHISEHFIQKTQIFGQFFVQDSKVYALDPIKQQEDQMQYFQQANLLIYFSYRQTQIKISTMYGLLNFIIRIYLWLMLINVYAKTNIFAFFYLIAVLIFWFKKLDFDLIRNINKAAIIILLLQYVVLLLDINSAISYLPIPYRENISLLQTYIDDPAWVDFIAVSSKSSLDNNNAFLISFIINSIIIFLTQLCYTILTVLSESMMKKIFEVYLKYQEILHKLTTINFVDPIIVNFSQYKNLKYKVIAFFYQQIIMNSYLLVSLLIFILLAGISGYIALVLLVITFCYIYVSIFLKVSQTQKIFKYTRVFFRGFNILQFILILISNVLNIPYIAQNSQIVTIASDIGALTSLQQLFLMLFIELWIDLYDSKSFVELSDVYREQAEKRQKVFLRGLAFQRNNFLITNLIREYKQVLSFDQSISSAIKITKQWHKSSNRDIKSVEYQFEINQQNKYLQQILKEVQQQKLIDDHKNFSLILANSVKNLSDVSLLYNYMQMAIYIGNNTYNINLENQIKINCWSFIKEDYIVLEEMLRVFDQRLKQLINLIGQSDQDQQMVQTLQRLKYLLSDQNEEIQQEVKVTLENPPKLVIQANASAQMSISSYIMPFIFSNMEALIVLLIVIYYLVNPCLLSFPLVVFAFCYYSIATRKYTHLIVIYLFLIILASQLLQDFLPPPNQITASDIEVIKFLYVTDPQTNQVTFSLPYLYFMFVIIFISQQVVRYKGNRYRSELQVQNLQQAFLRILINQPNTSKLNLWKYSYLDRDVVQRFNPFNIARYQIQNNFEKLLGDNGFFDGVFSDRKHGIDVYPPMAAIQILLMLYIIFLYPFMTDNSGYSFQESTKYFQFSSDMVIGVLVHVVSIIIERRIAILIMPRKKKLIIKYVYTLIIFALFCWFIYYIAPFQQLLTTAATQYNPSPALLAFSFFYFIYFYLSALQIKYGYKQFKSMNSLMTRRGYVNSYALSVYTAIPFLYELKIIIDWTFTSTNMTLFDWFRQFSIYLRAFRAKIQYYNAISYTLGKPLVWFQKIVGWIGFILIVIVIFGPMILFSGLNPIAQTNLVTKGSLSIALQVVNGNSFTLYQTSHFSTPPQTFTQAQFNADGFINVPVLQQMAANDIPEQFQSITFEPISDTNWGISSPNYYTILQLLSRSIDEIKTTGNSAYQFQLVTTYQLDRQITATIASDTQFYYPSETSYISLTILEALYATLTNCSAEAFIPNFYISLIRLNTIGNNYKPRPIVFYNNTPSGQLYQPYLYNVTLNLQCDQGVENINNTNNVYWSLYLHEVLQGLQLYVYCDKYQNVIGGYGFTALYASIVLVIAGFVRSMFDGNMPLIPYEMNPRSDNILQICEAIATLRVRKQYRDEYLMYYQLIDLIRSPQIMKYMSGSYPYLIQKAHQQKQRQQKINELQKNKSI